jgi:hypothetical protein
MVPLYDGLFEPWVRRVFKSFPLLKRIGECVLVWQGSSVAGVMRSEK